MSESITVEGKTLNQAIQNATSQLGAGGFEDINYEFVREHFRGGAYTVQITAQMCDPQEVAGRNAHRELAEAAREWMVECMESFGADARVRSSLKGSSGILVEVRCDEDGSLLIGKEGRNLQAFETLMREHFADQPDIELTLDIEDYRSRSRAPRRDDDRARGDDDRGRGDRGGDRGGRGGDRGGRGGDRGGRGGDRGGRGGDRGGDRGGHRSRRPGDEERDQAIAAETKAAVEQVLSGAESSIVLSDMNSYERHLAHTVVKESEGVGSRSVGDGPDRQVEVFAE